MPYDDIEFTNDRVYVYADRPYSGVGEELTDEGVLRSEIEFLDGRQHGWARDYYPNGKLSGETLYVSGRRHGIEREWFPNGKLREESHFEHDVLMVSRHWAEDGRLLGEYVRTEDDPLYRIAKQRSE